LEWGILIQNFGGEIMENGHLEDGEGDLMVELIHGHRSFTSASKYIQLTN
jgi:hypothetical protein